MPLYKCKATGPGLLHCHVAHMTSFAAIVCTVLTLDIEVPLTQLPTQSCRTQLSIMSFQSILMTSKPKLIRNINTWIYIRTIGIPLYLKSTFCFQFAPNTVWNNGERRSKIFYCNQPPVSVLPEIEMLWPHVWGVDLTSYTVSIYKLVLIYSATAGGGARTILHESCGQIR